MLARRVTLRSMSDMALTINTNFGLTGESSKKTEMGEDVQEVVARWVFSGRIPMETDWIGGGSEFVENATWETRVEVGAVRMCGKVARLWRKELVAWREREAARRVEEIVRLAAEEAVGICARHRYQEAVLPWQSWLVLRVSVEGQKVAEVRFVRQGSGRRHVLKTQVERADGTLSGWWQTATPKEAWKRGFGSFDVLVATWKRMRRWRRATTADLGAWCLATLQAM